jgi:hypothetical protein
MKPPIKIEDVVKNEVKTEVVEPSNVPTAPINSGPATMGQVAPKKEEEYDSSATVRREYLPYLFIFYTYFFRTKQ